MEYFGIIKPRRVRKVYSKTKGTDVNVYDYVVETINSSSGQSYAFSVNEDKNKVLASQGMTNGALGTVYFYTRVQTYTGKDGQETDYNNVFPSRFKLYAQNVPEGDASVKSGTKNAVEDIDPDGKLPF